MSDYLIKTLAYNGQIRAYAALTTETVSEAQRRHHMWPTAAAALGRTLTAGLLLGAMLKDEERLNIKIEGDGPLGAIVVDANAKGEVRGYVTNPQTHLDLNEKGKLDVSGAVGSNGTLSVVKDLGLKDYFTGQVPLVSGEIAEDFTYYLATSEQIPSSVGLGVLVNPDNTVQAAGGFIIQVLPGAEDSVISKIEDKLRNIKPVSTLIQEGYTPEQMLKEILDTDDLQVLETMPVRFKCRCSKERLADALISLGQEEITDILETEGQVQAVCHFCNEEYLFTAEELEKIKEQAE